MMLPDPDDYDLDPDEDTINDLRYASNARRAQVMRHLRHPDPRDPDYEPPPEPEGE
jgi:hypothetical protein